MADEAPLPIPDPPSSESTMFGISIRGIIALILILTLCLLSAWHIEIKEPLYTLVSTVVAFYFGHQTAIKQNQK